MGLLRTTDASVVELREILGTGFDYVSTYDLEKVLKLTRDVDLAACALSMTPRPEWVVKIVGPLA